MKRIINKNLISSLAVFIIAAAAVTLPSCDSIMEPEPPSSSCLDRAIFGDPAQSSYVLPYPVGSSYEVVQGYCGSGPWSSHNNRFALDFGMSIGDPVTASRGGTVVYVIDEFDDSGLNDDSKLNSLVIQHEDGTAALYAHLRQGSATVAAGTWAVTGEVIARSGNSGFTDNRPHFISSFTGTTPITGSPTASRSLSATPGGLWMNAGA